MLWLICLVLAGSDLRYGLVGILGDSIQLDRPSLVSDYRVVEQLTEPWVLDVRLGRSCVLRDIKVRPQSLEFRFREDLKWSDGSPISKDFLKREFRKLFSDPRFRGEVEIAEGDVWRISWPRSLHTVFYMLQRSEFGIVHPSNRQVKVWAQLGPTFGPYQIDPTHPKVRIVPNPRYPEECGKASFSVSFASFETQSLTDAFVRGDLSIMNADTDLTPPINLQRIAATNASEITVGTNTVWSAVVFGKGMPSKQRRAWRSALLRCMSQQPGDFPKGKLELVPPPGVTYSQTLETLQGCAGSSMAVRFDQAGGYKEIRSKGTRSTFNLLGLRYPDPEDKWRFLGAHYPYLRERLITDRRMEAAQRLRKNGSWKGYEDLDAVNARDPWIVQLNGVKMKVFLRKGLKFKSESDAIFRLNGITE